MKVYKNDLKLKTELLNKVIEKLYLGRGEGALLISCDFYLALEVLEEKKEINSEERRIFWHFFEDFVNNRI